MLTTCAAQADFPLALVVDLGLEGTGVERQRDRDRSIAASLRAMRIKSARTPLDGPGVRDNRGTFEKFKFADMKRMVWLLAGQHS